MKKIIASIALFSISVFGFAQKEKSGLIELNTKGVIASVEFRDSERGKAPNTAKDFFTQYLEAKEADHFEKVPHVSKQLNFVHEHYDQYYKGVKVEGAGYNLHFKDGQMYFANGNYVKVEALNAIPSIDKEKALTSFLKFKKIERESVVSSKVELIVKEISKEKGNDVSASAELVYRISLQADHNNNNEIGFVSAHTGQVRATEPRLTDLIATFATRYSDSRQASTDPVTGGHRLFDNTRGATIHTRNMQNNTTQIANAVELVDNDNNWTAAEYAASKNDMGLDVHWALQQIYDYLRNSRGISSFDNNNRAIEAYFRYGTNTDNASWDIQNDVLYFGQGGSRFNPLASLDVVAHEFGHGITDFQIGWPYDGSGITSAFHEGMSDIWGAILEQRIRPNATWRIGEQVMANGKPYLRNIETPTDTNAEQQVANTFGSSQYNSGDIYVKGGVLSHWFYILVNGKTSTNGVNNVYGVTGVGLDQAEQLIAEAVFNNYLDNTTTYPAIRTAMLSAATALFGSCSAQYIATANAWSAVGVGNSVGSPVTAKYTYGGSPTYYAIGSASTGVSSSSQTIYVELANYGASSVYSWSVTSQNNKSASISFNGKSATMSLSSGAQRTITCQVTTETCGTASFSFSAYNFGSSFRVASYPNPANETLVVAVQPVTDESLSITAQNDINNILTDQFENVSIKLINEEGQPWSIGVIKGKSCTLDVSNVPSGRYFLHINTVKGVIKEQIIIKH